MIVVAEIGMNHDGNWDLCHELIRQAKLAGADIAKFQFGWRDQPNEINHITSEIAAKLRAWCDYWEIEIMASIVSEAALELARRINMRRYKIAARTVLDKPKLVENILAEGKETFVSVGMWDRDYWPFGPPTDRRRYIYCRSRYPTYPKDMVDMPRQFTPREYYGYSDHMHGIEGCLIAIARGAQYIEKHFTLNRADQTIRDHLLSATPCEFRQLTEQGRAMARLVKVIGAK